MRQRGCGSRLGYHANWPPLCNVHWCALYALQQKYVFLWGQFNLKKYCFLCVPLSRNDSTVLISKHMISSVNQGYMMQLMIKMLQRSQRIYFEIVHLKEKKLITPQRDAAVQDEDNIQTFSSLHWCAPYHPDLATKICFWAAQKFHVKISSLCA